MRERNTPLQASVLKRFVMPLWMEVLINVLGYAGFVGIATFNRSSGDQAAGKAGRTGCCVS
jgi:hypothetical protein